MLRLKRSALVFVPVLLAGCMPANALHDRVRLGVGALGPLPPDKVLQVRTTLAEASDTVLKNERETGWPDPDIAWQDGGCVLIALYEPQAMSFAPDPGPPYPVYIVRLVDLPARTATWVMVDARTGELGADIGDVLKGGCGNSAKRQPTHVTFADAD